MFYARSLSVLLVLGMIAASFAVAIGGVRANQGTSDTYGYRWTDSNSPAPTVSLNWVDIRSTGTSTGLSGDDYYAGPFNIGFNFTFYGNVYSSFYASTNGLVTFGTGSSTYSNRAIPYSGSPNNFIAPYWDDDQVSYGTGTVVYQTVGTAPDQQLVIQYTNVSRLGSSFLMTFEVVLNQTGDIWLQYLTLNGMTGSSATVGIENSGGTIGCQYSYNTNSLSDGLAIRFSMGPVTVTANPQTQLAAPGMTANYTLTIQNREPGADSFAIVPVSANGWTIVLYNETMVPLTDTDADGLPDTGMLASMATFTAIVTVTVPAMPLVGQDITTVNVSSRATPTEWDTVALTTNVQPAWFAPPHSAGGLDTDHDGYYDYLAVNASIYVLTPGWITLTGYLYTSGNSYITSSYCYNSTYLYAGNNTMQLLVIGWYIRNYGIDGPYHMTLTLYSGGSVIDTDVVYTSAYSHDAFMQQPGVLTPPFWGGGVDTNSDGLYDYLQLNVTFNVSYAGRFVVTAYLYDDSWNLIQTLSNDSSCSVGPQVDRMYFDPWMIFRDLTGGPYTVYVVLQAEVSGSLMSIGSSYWYAPSSLTRTQFSPPPAMFQAPHSDHANDTDSDGYYDYLAVDVQVNASVADTYTVTGDLLDWLGDTIESASNTTFLSAGLNTVELIFPGWPIRAWGDSGPWDVSLTLSDVFSTILDTATYTTAYYYYGSFRGTPAIFSAPYADFGLDVNQDSLFDYLVVEANVTVDVEGDYRILGDLYDHWYLYITSVTNTTHLTVGDHTIELMYPGWIIRNDATTGVFYVDLYLYDSSGRSCDSHTYTTGSYSYTSFQTSPAQLGISHSSYGLDTNGDGLYEWLVINASVDIAMAGTYEISLVLNDGLSHWVANAANASSLATGAGVIQVRVPGWMIHANGVSGLFTASMTLLDGLGNTLDTYLYTTVSYNYASFNPSPPIMHSSYTPNAPSINGLFGSSEWNWATEVNLSADPLNGMPARMLVMNNDTMLFICYDVYGDTTQSSNDYAAVAFDTGNDNVTTNGMEDEFMVTPSNTVHWVYSSSSGTWVTDCSPFNDALQNHTGLAGSAGFGTSAGYPFIHRIYELAIPLALLDASPGDVLGFVGRSHWDYGVYDADTGLRSEWPATYQGSPPLTKYGDLSLATPASVPAPVTTSTLTGTSGLNGFYVGPVKVTLTATGGSGGVKLTQYALDGGAWVTYTLPFTISASGTHTVEYRSIDYANQYEAANSITLKVDAMPPTTSASRSGSEGTGGWFRSAVIVTLSAQDDAGGSGVASTQYAIDGGAWMTYSVPFTVDGSGRHSVNFTSTDNAGGTEATQTITVNIDMYPPTTVAQKNGAHVWLNATDNLSSVQSTMYRIDGGAWMAYMGMIAVSGNGTHTIEFYSTDTAGNSETARSIKVTIGAQSFSLDNALPFVMIGVAAAIAALLLLFFVMRRRKQAAVPFVPPGPQPYQSVPPQPPGPPQMPPPPRT